MLACLQVAADRNITFAIAGATGRLRPLIRVLLEPGHRVRDGYPEVGWQSFERWVEAQDWEGLANPSRAA